MSKALIGFHSIRQGLFQLSFIGKRSYTIQLTDRKVLKISGADSRKFLQGQCTNDINQLKTNGDSIAAAFLTTKGRIFSDAILYYHQSSPVIEGDILIEGNGKLITDLQKYLTLFKLRSKFTMEILNCKVFLNTDVINKQQLAEYQKQQSDKVLVSSLDPRIANYGCRVITSADAVLDVMVQDTVEYYHQIRDYLYGIADSVVIVNKIPFECNLDLLNYLNYHKGCYVGQELTARTKYKGVIRKRLLPFYVGAARNGFETVDKHQLLQHIISSEVTGFRAQVGDKVFGSSEPENSVGEIIAIDSKGRIGIAMVQLDVVHNHNGSYFVPFTTNDHTNSLQRDNLGITIFRPDWFIGLDEKTYLQKD